MKSFFKYCAVAAILCVGATFFHDLLGQPMNMERRDSIFVLKNRSAWVGPNKDLHFYTVAVTMKEEIDEDLLESYVKRALSNYITE